MPCIDNRHERCEGLKTRVCVEKRKSIETTILTVFELKRNKKQFYSNSKLLN